jgi:hypothetical protein
LDNSEYRKKMMDKPKDASSSPEDSSATGECVKPRRIDMPPGWSCVAANGPGPFVTRATFMRPDGALVAWTSRNHRKRHSPLDEGRGSTWWAPRAIGWWIGVLFALGATCFALGAMPAYASLVGNGIAGLTFFLGSIPFTTAAFLQYLQTVNARGAPPGVDSPRRFRVLTWEPRRIDWLSSTVQFVGTLFFNVSTFRAMYTSLTTTQVNHLVWRPDAYGSTCFLIASLLAWMEVGHGIWSWHPRSLSWLIAALNVAGSVAFGVSAITAYAVPTTGEPLNVALMNLGTFVGGLCFLAGGILLLPERTLAPD